jgi:hypothetical protein
MCAEHRQHHRAHAHTLCFDTRTSYQTCEKRVMAKLGYASEVLGHGHTKVSSIVTVSGPGLHDELSYHSSYAQPRVQPSTNVHVRMQRQCILIGKKTGPTTISHQAAPYCVLQQERDKQPRSPTYSMRIHNVARNAKWVSERLSALCRRTQYVFDAFDVVILEHVRSGGPSKQTSEQHSDSSNRFCSRHRTCGPWSSS